MKSATSYTLERTEILIDMFEKYFCLLLKISCILKPRNYASDIVLKEDINAQLLVHRLSRSVHWFARYWAFFSTIPFYSPVVVSKNTMFFLFVFLTGCHLGYSGWIILVYTSKCAHGHLVS